MNGDDIWENHPGLSEKESLALLDRAERKLRRHVKRYDSTAVLRAINQLATAYSQDREDDARTYLEGRGFQWHPHIGAALAEFSVRWSNPHRRRIPTFDEFGELYSRAADFVLMNPLEFDAEAHEAFQEDFRNVLIRLSGTQLTASFRSVAHFGRASMLWDDAVIRANKRKEARGLNFDFEEAFQSSFGVALKDYLKVVFIASSAALGNGVCIERAYFEKSRQLGVDVPSEEDVLAALEQICVTPRQLRDEQERWQQEDRRYRCYDFNPLLDTPIIRAHGDTSASKPSLDKMYAPIPHLVARCASSRIYYRMVREHDIPGETLNRFQSYFGFVFEEYIGLLLRASFGDGLMSESELRGSGVEGKVVDWAYLEDGQLFAFECKACRFPQHTFGSPGADDYYRRGLRQISKGLNQLNEFTQQVRQDGGRFADIKEVNPILITYEDLFLMSDDTFRERVATYKGRKLELSDWKVFSMTTIEKVQPHLSHGLKMADVMEQFEQSGSIHETIQELATRTGKHYRDSILMKRDRELHASLGLDKLPASDAEA
jgi:hypothetical protein